MSGPFPLTGFVQHYDWGGYDFIPALQGIENAARKPYAELWLGAHPKGMSRIDAGSGWEPLDQFIARNPDATLGKKAAAAFQNRLPFLFKVLDVRQMLSIQAHPTKAAAGAGFRRENELGIPVDAPNRVYRDDNHKPEALAALTGFWLLHGFKTPEAIRQTLSSSPELRVLSDRFAADDISGLYRYVMEMPQQTVDQILAPLWARLDKEWAVRPPAKDRPDYWATLAFRDYTHDGHFDRGIFSIYLFNLVHLQPGEGIYQGAGIPHAYLEGVNMELMANSDNVYRGGLTTKHIDVPELLANLDFTPVTPRIIQPVALSRTESAYPTPAPDFALSRIDLKPGETQEEKPEGPAVYMVLEGNVSAGGRAFKKGETFIAFYGADFRIGTNEGARLYKASVGG